MSAAPGDVETKLDRVEARLDAMNVKREAAFEAAKRKYGGDGADPNRWLRHIREIGREVADAVRDDPWAELAPLFDDVADAWLAASPESRDAIAAALRARNSLKDGHLGHVEHARKSLVAKPDALVLRRAVAVAAIGAGGSDCRDATLQMRDFVRDVRAAGLDPTAEFERVAALASATDRFGSGPTSVRDSLLSFVRGR